MISSDHMGGRRAGKTLKAKLDLFFEHRGQTVYFVHKDRNRQMFWYSPEPGRQAEGNSDETLPQFDMRKLPDALTSEAERAAAGDLHSTIEHMRLTHGDILRRAIDQGFDLRAECERQEEALQAQWAAERSKREAALEAWQASQPTPRRPQPTTFDDDEIPF